MKLTESKLKKMVKNELKEYYRGQGTFDREEETLNDEEALKREAINMITMASHLLANLGDYNHADVLVDLGKTLRSELGVWREDQIEMQKDRDSRPEPYEVMDW